MSRIQEGVERVVVFDLDGCVYDDRWRLDLIDLSLQGHEKYDEYHSQCFSDRPLPPGGELLTRHIASGDFPIFITSRPMKFYAQTRLRLLEDFGIDVEGNAMIFMRGNANFQPTVEMKRETMEHVLQICRVAKAAVVAAYDDRIDIVNAYRTLGVRAYELSIDGVLMGEEHQGVDRFVMNLEWMVGSLKTSANVSAPTMLEATELMNHARAQLTNHGRIEVSEEEADAMEEAPSAAKEVPAVSLPPDLPKPTRRPGFVPEELKRPSLFGFEDPFTPPVTKNFPCSVKPVVEDVISDKAATMQEPMPAKWLENQGPMEGSFREFETSQPMPDALKPKLPPEMTPAPKAVLDGAAAILAAAAQTYAERNSQYKDNYKKVGAVMKVLFPDGVQLEDEEDYNIWHLFELMIVKLTRFTNSDLTHADSIHDLSVYAAMVENLVGTHNVRTRINDY